MRNLVIIVLTSLALTGWPMPVESATRKTNAVAPKSLTYANVVSFFQDAKLRPTEVQKRCTIFFEGEWKSTNIYSYCMIIVENSDEDIQVTFYLTDAHEMNWVTEFVDAPFFAQAETQKLFGLVNSGRDVRGEKLGRYRVDFHKWEPRHAQILVFSFTRL